MMALLACPWAASWAQSVKACRLVRAGAGWRAQLAGCQCTFCLASCLLRCAKRRGMDPFSCLCLICALSPSGADSVQDVTSAGRHTQKEPGQEVNSKHAPLLRRGILPPSCAPTLSQHQLQFSACAGSALGMGFCTNMLCSMWLCTSCVCFSQKIEQHMACLGTGELLCNIAGTVCCSSGVTMQVAAILACGAAHTAAFSGPVARGTLATDA